MPKVLVLKAPRRHVQKYFLAFLAKFWPEKTTSRDGCVLLSPSAGCKRLAVCSETTSALLLRLTRFLYLLPAVVLEPPLPERHCASGAEGLFGHPAEIDSLISREQYTIAWSKRRDEACPQQLAALIDHANKLPHHKGLARSATALGVRCKSGKISEAQKLLQPSDPRWSAANVKIQDKLCFQTRAPPNPRILPRHV